MAKQKDLSLKLENPKEYDYSFAGKDEIDLCEKFAEERFQRDYKRLMSPIKEKYTSPIANSLMNMALRENGSSLRVANQAQLEYVRSKRLLGVSNYSVCTGIVWRDRKPAQDEKRIVRSLRVQLHNPKLPIYIPANAYDLKTNIDYVNIKVTDPSKIIRVPIFKNARFVEFNSCDVDPKTGFPTKSNDNGRRDITLCGGIDREAIYNCGFNQEPGQYCGPYAAAAMMTMKEYPVDGKILLAKLKK